MQFGHPRFETPRSALVPQAFLPVFLRGWAMAILIFLTIPVRRKCVPLRTRPHLALFGIFPCEALCTFHHFSSLIAPRGSVDAILPGVIRCTLSNILPSPF